MKYSKYPAILLLHLSLILTATPLYSEKPPDSDTTVIPTVIRERYKITFPREIVRGSVLAIRIGVPQNELASEEVREEVNGDAIIQEKLKLGYVGTLYNSDDRVVATGSSFPVAKKEAAERKETDEYAEYADEYILLGLGSTITPGVYRLRIEKDSLPESQGRALLFQEDIRILPGTFKSEIIPLNREMSKLRSEPDPRKVAEAVEIQGIYNYFKRQTLKGRFHLTLPVENYPFSSWYGDRRTYRYSDGEQAYWVHSGVDIAAPIGTEVRAGADGKVIMVRDRIVTGKTVVIEHYPGFYGVFFHLDSFDVQEGDIVKSDTLIGRVGMTGLATGPHLHWEIRVSGIPVDPLLLTTEGITLLDR